TAEQQGARGTKGVFVLGGEDIRELEFNPKELHVMVGASISIQLLAHLQTGAKLELKQENIDRITVTPSDLGQVEGLTFTGLREGEGMLSVQIDGFERTIPVRVGSVEQPWP